MKNNYAILEKEYLDTISRLSEITGWPAAQAESVVGLVVQAAEKKANAVAERNVQDLKNAKYLATKKLLQNYRRLREAINLGTEHALKLLKDTEYQRLMQAEESLQNQKVLSVALIAAANRVLWARVNAALECLKEICLSADSPRVSRGYEVLFQRYAAPNEKSTEQAMAELHIEKSEYYRVFKTAVDTLSVLLFGAGNTEDFLFYQRKDDVIEQ